MSLDFWDGILIASMFWFIISSVCLLRGYVCGICQDFEWSEGYEAGWKAAEEYHETEILGAELKAAIKDLKLYAGCKVCKHGDFKFPDECMDCSYDNNNWEWRGVCEGGNT